MRIVLDTNVLVQLLSKNDEALLYCPVTGNVVDRSVARATALVDQIDAKGGTVVIPAPVLAEYLVGIDPGLIQTHLALINSFTCFEVVAFDQLAAVECALLVDESEQKVLDPDATKAKMRFDRQIIAISKAVGAQQIWTHDKGLYRKAAMVGLDVKSLADVTPAPVQLQLASLNQ